MYTISPKIKSERNIVKISPDEKDEYFFWGGITTNAHGILSVDICCV